MNLEEVRDFKIDKGKKPDCKLPTNEIKIKKQEDPSNSEGYKFSMVGEREVFIECFPSYVPHLKAKGKAEGCGIGKMLMQLCFNENNIHDVQNNDKNRALAMIDRLKDMMEDKELADKVQKWAETKCSKLLFLDMESSPKSKAHVYFNSAIASGFDYMFIDIDNEEFYPKTGPCPVKTLKERYNDEGYMVNGDEKVKAWEQQWFFCHPKTPSTSRKCAIL